MQPMTQWLVLLVALPPHPSSVRVRVWRKLRALGAVALKKAVYILPFTAENLEQFQWLTQEIQKARGEATLLKVDQIENMTRADVVRRFQEAREQDYQALAAGYRKVAQRLERATSGRARAALGHAPAAPRRPARLGLAHQALHRSGRRVRLRPPGRVPAGRDPVRRPRGGVRASGRGLHLRDPDQALRAPRRTPPGARRDRARGGPAR